MPDADLKPIHGDNTIRVPKGQEPSPTVDFYCRVHGWVTVERRNAALQFTNVHNEKSGCTPLLDDLDEANALMTSLAAEHEWVCVFWDRGWEHSGPAAEISIIEGGDGQNPRAFITPMLYERLRVLGVIAPNSLNTFKARMLHEFVVPESGEQLVLRPSGRG